MLSESGRKRLSQRKAFLLKSFWSASFQVYEKNSKRIIRMSEVSLVSAHLGLTLADLRPPSPWAPVSWVMVTRSMGPAIRMLSRGLYLLLRLPVLMRECGDPERRNSRAPSPIELLPRRGTSGVTGKNPSSSSPIPFPKDDKLGSKSYIIIEQIKEISDTCSAIWPLYIFLF